MKKDRTKKHGERYKNLLREIKGQAQSTGLYFYEELTGNSSRVYLDYEYIMQCNVPCGILFMPHIGMSIHHPDIREIMSDEEFAAHLVRGDFDKIKSSLMPYFNGYLKERGFNAKVFKMYNSINFGKDICGLLRGDDVHFLDKQKEASFVDWIFKTREKKLKKRTKSELVFQKALDRIGASYEAEVPYVYDSGKVMFIDFVVSGKYDCIIEIDGEYHKYNKKKDRFRDRLCKYIENIKSVFRIDNDFLEKESRLVDGIAEEVVEMCC